MFVGLIMAIATLAIALSLLLQIAVVYVPVLNAGFGTTPLDVTHWSICVALGSTVLWADELRKLAHRRSAGSAPLKRPRAPDGHD